MYPAYRDLAEINKWCYLCLEHYFKMKVSNITCLYDYIVVKIWVYTDNTLIYLHTVAPGHSLKGYIHMIILVALLYIHDWWVCTLFNLLMVHAYGYVNWLLYATPCILNKEKSRMC